MEAFTKIFTFLVVLISLSFQLSLACTPFFSELHFNFNSPTSGLVHIATPDTIDLNQFRLTFYDGVTGLNFGDLPLAFPLKPLFSSRLLNGWTTSTIPIQLSCPSTTFAIALIDGNDIVVDFISLSSLSLPSSSPLVTAQSGPAAGLTAISVHDRASTNSTGILNVRRTGTGFAPSDFTWRSLDDLKTSDRAVIVPCPVVAQTVDRRPIWINSVHVLPLSNVVRHRFFTHFSMNRNVNVDTNEGFELVFPSDASLSGWSVHVYDRPDHVHTLILLSSTAKKKAFSVDYYGVKYTHLFFPYHFQSIRHGRSNVKSTVALALTNSLGQPVQFISLDGSFTATSGPVMNLKSADITSTSTATTSPYHSFNTGVPLLYNTDSPTKHQARKTSCVSINEFHYDNKAGDKNEAIEIAAPAGTDLTGWKILLYNGNEGSGRVYKTVQLSGIVEDMNNGFGFIVEPVKGIQNGGSYADGFALINSNNVVVQFICYEGTLTATEGDASGMTCTDVGVVESENTPTGYSIQKTNSGVWAIEPATFGAVNMGQVLSLANCENDVVPDVDVASPFPPPSSSGSDTADVTSTSTATPAPPTGQSAKPMKIFEIQGSSFVSPYMDEWVVTEGVVTAVSRRQFFIQDPTGDGDEKTSDGIAVYVGAEPQVSVGDVLSVTGKVNEYIPSRIPLSQPVTQLVDATWNVLSTESKLPTPVGLDPPTEGMQSGVEYYEQLEHMRVFVKDPLVIAPKTRSAEFWTVSDNGKKASVMSKEGRLVIRERDFNPERIQIDLDTTVLQGFRSPFATVGDRMSSINGVLTYVNGIYEVIPTEPFTVTPGDDKNTKVGKITSITKQPGRITVASMNAYNLYFTDDISRFERFAKVIVSNLQAPDIIALQEIQDNDGPVNSDVTSASSTLRAIAEEVLKLGGPLYKPIDNRFIGDDTNGGQRGGNIRCAYLYNDNRVELLTTDTVVDAIDQQNDSRNPFYRSRLPLVATFKSRESSKILQVTNVHFSSKFGSAPLFGLKQPIENLQADDDVNGGVEKRLRQAKAVKEYLIGDKKERNQIVLGDFNEFQFNAPVTEFMPEYIPLMNSIPENERYSYLYEGNAQALDQIVVSAYMADNALFEPIHCNAGYTDAASDHDPLLVSVKI